MRGGGIKINILRTFAGLAVAFFAATYGLAQTTQDSTGHIPAVRTQITPPSQASTWWKRAGEQHLLDFSENKSKVVVDPIVQVMVGIVQFNTPERKDLTIWDNIRGARFQAELDEKFYIGGELLERQGVAEPLLGLWAVQNRIPGWGRSKLGRDNSWNTVEQAYYDVSRSRGWTGWSNGIWSADAGIDAMHFGAGRASALISKTAVPAPYARVGLKRKNHRTEVSISQWMSDQRGPLGATAESLLKRSHVSTLRHAWEIKPHWTVQGAYQFIREKSVSSAPAGWETLGMSENDEYRAMRHSLAAESQLHFRFLSTGRAVIFVQQSFDIGGNNRRSIGSNDSFRKIHALTSLAGMRLETKCFELIVEAYRQSDVACATCYEYEALAPETSGPQIAVFNHAGMPTQGTWNESVRIEGSAKIRNRGRLSAIAEQSSAATSVQIQSTYLIQHTWPLRLQCSIGRVNPLGNLETGYHWYSIGLCAAVSDWK